MADTCRGCIYFRSLSENQPNLKHYCNYLLDTGNTRDCPAESCDKKLTKEEAMKKLTQDDKQEIIRLRIEGNVPVKLIAEKFHVSKSSIFNIVSEWKQHGDSVFSEEEIINELHEQTISEAADDDYVCYEVTGDADIEAYMADRNKKEPETAATETGSEQEICEDIPADIIPETEENVKPESENAEPLIPQAVIEACWARVDDLRNQIAAEQAVIDDWKRQIAEIKDFLELARIANPVGGAV